MFRVKVCYIGKDGLEYDRTFTNRTVASCIYHTKKGGNFARLINTTSWEGLGSLAPTPPADYTPARFKVKKGRFGRMVAGQWIGEKDV